MLSTTHLSDLGAMLEDAIDAHRSATAVIEVERRREVRRLSYGEVAEEARRIGGVLQGLGVRPLR